jgi:gas vesicle protein
MKKVFAIFAVAAIMVACNNKADKKVVVKDSAAMMDSINKMMDNTKDSINKMMNKMQDSTNKMINNIKDTVNKMH